MNQLIDGFLRVVDGINEHVGRWMSFVAIFMAVIVVYEVAMRYIFQSPTIWAMEVNQALLCWYTALAGGHVLLYGSHVNVDILYGLMSVRKRAFTDLVTAIFSLSFIFVLIWMSWDFFKESWDYSETSLSILELRQWPIKIVIPIGGILLFLQLIAKFIRDVRILITGVEPKARPSIFSRGEE